MLREETAGSGFRPVAVHVGAPGIEQIGDAWYLEPLDPLRRKQGIGTAMIEALVASPHLTGLSRLVCGIKVGAVGAEPLVRFVLRAGLLPTDEVDFEDVHTFDRELGK